MSEKNIIPSYCLQVSNNKFVPFWELEYISSEDYGEGFIYENRNYWKNLTPCYYNIIDKTIIFGKIKDFYPNNLEFKINENIYVEYPSKRDSFTETLINDIQYRKFEVNIINVKDTEDSILNYYFTKEEIENFNINDIFEIHIWKPIYILDNGKEIEWEHQMRHKFTPVSFEFAKVLKNIGFDIFCDSYYMGSGKLYSTHRANHNLETNTKEMYSAPEMNIAIVWLNTFFDLKIDNLSEVDIVSLLISKDYQK